MLVWSIVSTLIVGLISLMVVVRLLGKKSLSEMTPFDFVYTLVLGGILEESLYDDQVSIGHLLLAFALWAFLIFIMEKLTYKFDWLNKLAKGEPSVLVYYGQLVLEEIENNNVEMEQLRGLMRMQGCYSLENAVHVILETGGQVSVVMEDSEDKVVPVLVVDEGFLNTEVLENHDLDENWVKEELAKIGHPRLEDILYAEWSRDRGFYVVPYADVRKKKVLLDG